MSESDDLQNIVTDLSAAIAGRKTYGRTELEGLRRRLARAVTAMRTLERSDASARHALEELAGMADRGVAELAAAVAYARATAGIPAPTGKDV